MKTEKERWKTNKFLNIVILQKNWIMIIKKKLISLQMEFYLVPNRLEKCYDNPHFIQFNNIQKSIRLCIKPNPDAKPAKK